MWLWYFIYNELWIDSSYEKLDKVSFWSFLYTEISFSNLFSSSYKLIILFYEYFNYPNSLYYNYLDLSTWLFKIVSI